ncbi:MAG: GtrA family protein [Desulfofustis sp.]|nr:GtrA family protein [Desulfofustis sp.]
MEKIILRSTPQFVFLFRQPYTTRLAESAMPDHNTIVQFIKYALAGGLATAFHIVVFHLLAWKCFPALQPNDHAVRLLRLDIREINDYQRARNSMISNTAAFLIANMVAYVTNILWVFERGRHSFLVEIVLFYLVSGISVVLGTTLMGILIKRFGMLTTYAFTTNIVTAVMINYAVRKFFIFQG